MDLSRKPSPSPSVISYSTIVWYRTFIWAYLHSIYYIQSLENIILFILMTWQSYLEHTRNLSEQLIISNSIDSSHANAKSTTMWTQNLQIQCHALVMSTMTRYFLSVNKIWTLFMMNLVLTRWPGPTLHWERQLINYEYRWSVSVLRLEQEFAIGMLPAIKDLNSWEKYILFLRHGCG